MPEQKTFCPFSFLESVGWSRLLKTGGGGGLLISCYCQQVAGRTTKQKQDQHSNQPASQPGQHKHSHSVQLPGRGIFFSPTRIPLGFKVFSANTSTRQNVTLFLIQPVDEIRTCNESTHKEMRNGAGEGGGVTRCHTVPKHLLASSVEKQQEDIWTSLASRTNRLCTKT